MPKLVTKDSLKELLQCGNPDKIMHTVGRALVVLFNNQEIDEQHSSCVAHNNGIGFTRGDVAKGTVDAKQYLRTRTLNEKTLSYWTLLIGQYPYLCKYDQQLNDAALRKQAAKIEKDLEKL